MGITIAMWTPVGHRSHRSDLAHRVVSLQLLEPRLIGRRVAMVFQRRGRQQRVSFNDINPSAAQRCAIAKSAVVDTMSWNVVAVPASVGSGIAVADVVVRSIASHRRVLPSTSASAPPPVVALPPS